MCIVISLDRWRYHCSEYLVWAHIRTLPVVQVVMNIPVTDAEFEIFKEPLVIHHIKSGEDVKTFLLVRENM